MDTPPAIESVVTARFAVSRCIEEIVRFHREERFLMTQIGRGIGDIATTEKSRATTRESGQRAPRWGNGLWGKVASDGWNCRCGVFAEYLAPTLRAATESVAHITNNEVEEQARFLSDLSFRASLADPVGDVDRLAAGIAAFWFERHLVRLSGPWIHNLESTERHVATIRQRGTDSHAEISARGTLARLLLENSVLHRRSAEEGTSVATMLDEAVQNPTPARLRLDAEALCDTTSRLGLSLLRWGDHAGARQALSRSHTLAEHHLGGEESRMARADSNLGEAWCEAGDIEKASFFIERALAIRVRLAGDSRNHNAEWRRLTLTEQAWAVVACKAGKVIDAVRRGTALVEDRRSRLGGLDNLNTASARLTLGEALLDAGHPHEASQHISEAGKFRLARMSPMSHWPQYDLLLASRAATALGDHQKAAELLESAPVMTDWFAERVSFRLSYEARYRYAAAIAESGDPRDGMRRLTADLGKLLGAFRLPPADPLVLSFQREQAYILLKMGQYARAHTVLSLIDEQEAEVAGGLAPPAHAVTLQLLARVAHELADHAAARNYFRRALQLTEHGMDATHPVILGLRQDEALRCLSREDTAAAQGVLAPLLERTPLAHGLAALADGHPLLVSARTLAQRIGLQTAKYDDDDHTWNDS